MDTRTRVGWVGMGAALVLALAFVAVLGDHQRELPGDPRSAAAAGAAGAGTAPPQPTPSGTVAGSAGPATGGSPSSTAGSSRLPERIPSRSPGTAAAWMHRLAPGEKPPQFVLFSFDGAGDHEHWQRMLPLARRVGAHFSGFLSGIYLLDDAHRNAYTGPGHPPGRASISFGGAPDEVRTRINDLNAAIADGDEIGTHYNGHFCRGAEPSVGFWQTAQWNSELDEFLGFVRNAQAQGLRVDPAIIRGGRTPCLEGRWDQVFPALRAHGMNYDSSKVSDGVRWPELDGGVWEFPMPLVRVPALGRKVIMMDYNLWFSLNGGREDPGRSAEFSASTVDTYRAVYQAAFNGNRAPLVVGNHFNDWAGGAFSTAVERFMGEVCTRPETVCATYSEVIRWMELQDPAVLNAFRSMPPARD
jgi:hypothetical protein